MSSTLKASQTPGVRFKGGLPLSVPNSTYDGDGFYISHNDRDTHLYGGVTTALVLNQGSRFYILRGDHRQAYAPLLAQGEQACLQYYRSLPEQQHPMSDKLPD